MRILLALFAALLLTLPAAQAAPSGIKGADDRAEVDGRAYPWSTIGRLTGPNGLQCTATLIGRDLVLTAAHCLWDAARGDWAPAADMTFAAGWRAGWRLGTAQVETYDIASGYQGPLTDHLGRGVSDWALLHLREPLGDTAGWLGLLPLAPDSWERLAAYRPVVVQAGYSADRPMVLTAHVGCHLLGWPERGLVGHDCDATEGDSGAPLFAWVDGAFRIIGLHVASVLRPAGMAFGGPDYPDGFGAAVPAGTFAEVAAGFGATALGNPAAAAFPAREVGVALELLGYRPAATGLTAAVRAFERDQGLHETGQPTAAILGEALNALR